MEAWELASVIVSLTAIFLVAVLVYVLTKLHSTIAQVESLIKKTNEAAIETKSVLSVKTKKIENEIQRVNQWVDQAEQITNRADTHSRLVYGSFTRPVLMMSSLIKGTIRAAKLLINK